MPLEQREQIKVTAKVSREFTAFHCSNTNQITLKGPVHQLDMQVLIKGHCRCDQNAIGLLTFGGKGKEKFTYLIKKIQK